MPIQVDEHRADTTEMAACAVRSVNLTADDQTTTGVVLALQRRHDRFVWAADTNSVRIEDDLDADAEFRYELSGSPPGSNLGLPGWFVFECGRAWHPLDVGKGRLVQRDRLTQPSAAK